MVPRTVARVWPEAGSAPAAFPPESFFARVLADRVRFNHGLLRPGGRAQLQYVSLLWRQLQGTCVTQLKREPFTFTGWYPRGATLHLSSHGAPVQIDVLNAVPNSGTTPAAGITGAAVVLQGRSRDPKALADVASIKGKIVIARLAGESLPLGKLRAAALFTNDPGHAIPATYSPTFLGPLVAVPRLERALKRSGARALVAILPGPVPGHLYAPLDGEVAGLPAVYVTPRAGRRLLRLLAAGRGHARVTVAVAANVRRRATSYNLSGLIPGATSREIIISSHTDGTNAVEDNGPAAIMALVHYYCGLKRSERPAGIRVVLTGGHFAGRRGISAYIDRNMTSIRNTVDIAIEIEHLGARSVVPGADGEYTSTGRPAPFFVAVSPSTPRLVGAARLFAKIATPSLVLPISRFKFGAGGRFWSRVTKAIQIISGPRYLLSYDLARAPGALAYVDIGLMRSQTEAIARMIRVLARSSTAPTAPDQRVD